MELVEFETSPGFCLWKTGEARAWMGTPRGCSVGSVESQARGAQVVSGKTQSWEEARTTLRTFVGTREPERPLKRE